eukprot:CAMPEP_0172643568 /NCGR_PEP_ID=MMETSP1068-20121228/237455_1 /TAXON_ID=35684 /ORGANISM="Pseudopedinella elastica, Strain CCMP716" /LENGTH=94 /DNA_ID=CAMNT_0013457657 /DNA_START=175 /DNA_END=455 /DNA_ORIENTATION=+
MEQVEFPNSLEKRGDGAIDQGALPAEVLALSLDFLEDFTFVSAALVARRWRGSSSIQTILDGSLSPIEWALPQDIIDKILSAVSTQDKASFNYT